MHTSGPRPRASAPASSGAPRTSCSRLPGGAAPDVAAKAESKARMSSSAPDRAAISRPGAQVLRGFDRTAGGDLKCFARGQMVKDFEDGGLQPSEGGISDLVRSPFGFHIIKVTGSRPPHTTPIEEVRDTLRQEIQQDRGPIGAAEAQRRVRSSRRRGEPRGGGQVARDFRCSRPARSGRGTPCRA